MRVHAVGMRLDVADWGVALLSKDLGFIACLTPAAARKLAAELEQMATITERPGGPVPCE